MRNLCSMVVVLAMAMYALPVVAQPGPGDGPGMGPGHPLQAADANKDGSISSEEFMQHSQQMAEKRFQKLDANKDGAISTEEMPKPKKMRDRVRAMDGKRCADMLMRSDADKDGKLTFEEASAGCPQMTQEQFAQLDADKDGALTKAEAAKCPTVCSKACPTGAADKCRPRFADKLVSADTNKDGKTTLEEAKVACPNLTEEKFQKLDKDGDGALTSEEVKQGACPKGACPHEKAACPVTDKHGCPAPEEKAEAAE